jgi:crotonobetaine/carnitine-CoA ligase
MAPTLSSRPEKPDDADNPLRRVLMVPLAADYRAFEQRFGVRVSTGWGMTEIGFPVATADPPNAEACGRRSPAYEAKIVDADDYEVPDGEIGELVVRPRKPWTTMLGYFNNGEATARTWRNGWLHTADALRRDPDGNYYFVDRKADYLRTRGNNVSSVEVETEVRAHPEITDCACVAVPSDLSRLTGHTSRPAVMGDDDIKIVASRGQGSTLTEAQLLAYLVPRLPRYVIPRYIEFVDEFPRTPTGKIQKAVLRETVRETTGWDRVAAGVELPR